MLLPPDDANVACQLGKVIDVNGTDVHLREYNFDYSPVKVGLEGVRSDLQLSSPVTITVNPGWKLNRAGAFIGFWPDWINRTYRIEFQGDKKYRLKYKNAQDQWVFLDMSKCYGVKYDPQTYWPTGHDGMYNGGEYISRDHDCVFIDWDNDVLCFILKDYWEAGTYSAGDMFEFEADPTCRTIELPVLFKWDPNDNSGAVAYTINHVNSLIDLGLVSADPNIVFTGNAHGPVVEYKPGRNADILTDYVYYQFYRYGLDPEWPYPDSWYYHKLLGDIHCGTNSIRQCPTYKWWEFYQ